MTSEKTICWLWDIYGFTKGGCGGDLGPNPSYAVSRPKRKKHMCTKFVSSRVLCAKVSMFIISFIRSGNALDD